MLGQTESVEQKTPFKQPLDFKLVRDWVKFTEDGREPLEIRFFNALTFFGDLCGDGRQGPEGKFTGRNYCSLACAIFLHEMRRKFGPNIDAEVVNKQIPLPYVKGNGEKTYPHTVTRFYGTDQKLYFLDPTYGQINDRLNRIAIDKSANEEMYYLAPAFGNKEINLTEYSQQLLTSIPKELAKLSSGYPKRPGLPGLIGAYNNLLKIFQD